MANPKDGENLSQTITKKVGSAPILSHFIQRMGVVSIIDTLVPSHPNREISHGEAVAGLMAYLLNDGRALYRVEGWAEETSILGELFPGYRPQDWTDDRPGLDPGLDALYQKGLELIQGAISAHIVVEFLACGWRRSTTTRPASRCGAPRIRSGAGSMIRPRAGRPCSLPLAAAKNTGLTSSRARPGPDPGSGRPLACWGSTNANTK